MTRCSVCSHAKRAAIESSLASGADAKVVAARFELSERAISRHQDTHAPLPPRAAAASPARRRAPTRRPAPVPARIEADEAPPATSRSPQRVTARSKLDELLERVDTLLDDVDSEDASVEQRIAAIRAAVVPLKLLGQFTGEIGISEATVATSAHFKRLVGIILEALQPKEFTAAREAVIASLERAQRGDRPAEAA